MRSARRRRRGFAALGSLRIDQIGLPARRGGELLLVMAWRHVAGQAVARRAPVLRVYRGVLEVELASDDPGWRATLSELLPELGGRLAAAYPELRVRKVRLGRPGEGNVGPAVDVRQPDQCGRPPEAARPSASASSPRPRSTRPVEADDARDRLDQLMRRYLARQRGPARG